MRYWLFYGIALLFLAADQWSKNAVFSALDYDYSIPAAVQRQQIQVLPGFVAFEGGINTGISWSLFEDNNGILRLIMMAAILAIIITVHRLRRRHAILYAGLGFVLGGAMGNLWDRLHPEFGGVRDFIRLLLFDFPLFNVADSAITVGATLIILYLLFEHWWDPRAAPAAASPAVPPPGDAGAAI